MNKLNYWLASKKTFWFQQTNLIHLFHPDGRQRYRIHVFGSINFEKSIDILTLCHLMFHPSDIKKTHDVTPNSYPNKKIMRISSCSIVAAGAITTRKTRPCTSYRDSRKALFHFPFCSGPVAFFASARLSLRAPGIVEKSRDLETTKMLYS